MIDAIVQLIISIIVFSLGCFLVYKILKDTKKWDETWERENRQRPLVPKDWAESDISKLLTYLFALFFFFGGLIIMISSFLTLLKYLR